MRSALPHGFSPVAFTRRGLNSLPKAFRIALAPVAESQRLPGCWSRNDGCNSHSQRLLPRLLAALGAQSQTNSSVIVAHDSPTRSDVNPRQMRE
jgi:hypothetical protein